MDLSIDSSAETKTVTILLVDDEPTVLNVTRSLLQLLGYKVVAVLTPREALAIASDRQQQIDLFMTDIDMPEMNGYELLELIIAIRPGIRSLLVSGRHANSNRLGEQTNFIPKPYNSKLLQEKLEILFS